MPQYYPLFMDLKAQPVLVVGGGNIAFRKVQTLLHHEAVVYIVSPNKFRTSGYWLVAPVIKCFTARDIKFIAMKLY